MPVLSRKYRELVCTVGISETGKLTRLYPVDFRYMDFDRRYAKYQWVEMEIEKNMKDYRIDSYRPNVRSIRPIGTPLSTNKGWQKRKELVLPLISASLEEIEKHKKDGPTLGIFKPRKISFKAEKTNESWDENKMAILKQGILIGPKTKSLEKIPFKFSYQFECNNPKCKGHNLVIIDWEIGELYRAMKKKFAYSMDLVLDKMKEMWEKKMWSGERDSYLIVGTQQPFATFMVLGVFWPPKL